MNAAPKPLTTGQKDVAWRLAAKHQVLFSTPGTQRFDDALFDFTAEALNDERLALDAAIAATPHQPEQIILQPVAPGRIQFQWVGNGNYCSAFDWASMRCTGYIHRQHDSFHGHTWFGERIAFDVDGHKWRHDFHAVVDDFGNLVEVAL